MKALLPIILALTATVAACAPYRSASEGVPSAGVVAPMDTPLYDRLGGDRGIALAVNQVTETILADPRINSFFATADIPRFQALLAEQLCEATGGPCVYSGRSMHKAHAGMPISNVEFNALAEDVARSLNALGVPVLEQMEVMAMLSEMRTDIVDIDA